MANETTTRAYGGAYVLLSVAFVLLLIFAKLQSLGWAYALAGVAAVLSVVALLLFLHELSKSRRAVTPAPTPLPAATANPETYYDYKGDTHDVIDIEGIGPKYADKLHAAGIKTTARLCFVGAEEAARVTGAPVKSAEKWIAMCQLVKINGVGKQYAEALVRGGVMTVEELKGGDPALIAGKVSDYLSGLDSKVLGQNVTAKRVQGWQKKAATMKRVRQSIPTE